MMFVGRRIRVLQIVCATFVLSSIGCAARDGGPGEGLPATGTDERSVDDSARDTRQASLPIVGGSTTDSFPSTVLLTDENKSSPHGILCTGTVIGKRTVLTAAHCVEAFTGQPSIYFGADINNSSDPTLLGTVKVVGYAPHPQWNSFTLKNDIAILQLESDALTSASPILASPIGSETVGSTLTLVGFGTTSGFGSTGTGKKRVTQTMLDTFDATTLSWQDTQHNTCYGDSGGPAFLTFDDTPVLAGVTSWGDQTCQFSGVDTRVDAYAKTFITTTMAIYGDKPTYFDAATGGISGGDSDVPADPGPAATPDEPMVPNSATSCEGSCGGQAASGCWCDTQCAKFGDCCSDIGDHC